MFARRNPSASDPNETLRQETTINRSVAETAAALPSILANAQVALTGEDHLDVYSDPDTGELRGFWKCGGPDDGGDPVGEKPLMP